MSYSVMMEAFVVKGMVREVRLCFVDSVEEIATNERKTNEALRQRFRIYPVLHCFVHVPRCSVVSPLKQLGESEIDRHRGAHRHQMPRTCKNVSLNNCFDVYKLCRTLTVA